MGQAIHHKRGLSVLPKSQEAQDIENTIRTKDGAMGWGLVEGLFQVLSNKAHDVRDDGRGNTIAEPIGNGRSGLANSAQSLWLDSTRAWKGCAAYQL